MAARKPNKDEIRLYQAAMENDRQEITAKEAETVISDAKGRQHALNFLLGVGMLKSLQDSKGRLVFRAVGKAELSATKDLSGEENLVLGHIKAARNEGLWVKHLKAKTNLHQTVIDRCLKTLTQKKLIKRISSVQHPTRKIFMLEGYEPSVAMTGGPWYTDNELDVEFIQTLCKACLKFIQDISFPKKQVEGQTKLYPISQAPQYPSAHTIKKTLQQTRLTETELSVEHVEELLNILVLDGDIERIPAFGSALFGSQLMDDDDGSADESDEPRSRKKKKRKHDSSDSDEPTSKSKKRKRKKDDSTSDESDTDDDSSSRRRKKKRKKSKSIASSESEDDSDARSSKRSKKKKKKKADSDDSDSEDASSSKSKSKKKKKKSRKDDSDSDSSSSASESSDSEEERSRKSKSKTKRRKQSSSPAPAFGMDFGDTGHSVYRALRPEQATLGWTQAPCGHCPSFDFCKDGGLNSKAHGPVNPRECVYYKDWLDGSTVSKTIEEEF